MGQIRVNIKHRVSNAAIKPDVRNGRDVLVVPSAVAKFNTVLNGILYPEDELKNSYLGINETTAPLGHPVINNQHVSARSPVAINQFHIGAHNENARIEGDRILADMILDVEYAKRHPDGQRLLDAINSGKPISTSTGLYMEREDAPEGAEYNYIGRNYSWDHVAVLLDEEPAIDTSSGVGLMVNSAGDHEEVEVINSELELNDALPGSMEDMRKALREAVEAKYGNGFVDDFNGESLIFFQMDDEKGDTSYKIGYSVLDGQIQISDERQEVQRKTTWESVTNTIRNTLSKMFGTSPDATKATGLTANQSTGESEMTVTKEAFDALATKVDALVANAEKQPSVADQITEALKPVTDQLQANAEADKAKAAAEKATAVETVVNAKLATQEEAEALDLPALNILARNAAPGKKTAGIVGGSPVINGEQDSWADYDLNANMEAK
tara:strand:- start:280 stop:1602 length:1323 start_codon:yes stop_codon:yes gene_type:complete